MRRHAGEQTLVIGQYLDQLHELAEHLALAPAQVAASNAILRTRGNMSSATLPHVWQALLADPEVPAGAWIVSLAFGPGLTIAGALLRKTR